MTRGDTVTISAENDVYFDPYDVELNNDPYPLFRQLREEQPLYYNEQHDFYALSRSADVNKALVDERVALTDVNCSRLGVDASRPTVKSVPLTTN
jgi:cytochrome P450